MELLVTARRLWIPESDGEKTDVLHALDEVLAHPLFSNSKRYPALLRYVVEQTLKGRGHDLKERTIGIEVFGKSPDYDTNLDTVVRYTAGEVRKRLAVYYRDAAEMPIEIRLTARAYHAEFLRFAEQNSLRDRNEEEISDAEAQDSHRPLSEHAPDHGNKGRWKWAAIFAAAATLVLAVALTWNRAHNDAVNRFWGPLIEQMTPTTISLGGVVFDPRSKIGTDVASDVSAVNPYLSFENGLAMGRVAALLNARGGSYRVHPSSMTTLAEIRESPTVLVGAYNNDWTGRLTAPLRFHFTAHPDEQIVDAANPSQRWIRDASKPFNESPDYALVARFRNPSTNSMVTVIAGLQRFGTDAASQFVTSPDQLRAFDRIVGTNWRDRNVEVVLRVDVVNGRAGAPSIVATHVW